ncbi:OPT oligopeptide transporter protein-domain-containing protein [Xylaria sp. CBS 124048]|nr:OPT oligopeptide transporter protein-domain-containing protein [Xylaria sp. CBS 124048]
MTAMAPDRGGMVTLDPQPEADIDIDTPRNQYHHAGETGPLLPPREREREREQEQERIPTVKFLPEGRHFTFRGVAVGLLVGLVIVFSNMYFGLQTGWVSMMTMPASLLGFGIFRTLASRLSFPFSPVENVLVQSVAGGMAIMPLGCGFVGVLPAMEYLLKPAEQGPIFLSMGKLIIWALGLCYFGVVFAVPLRRQVIIRERLKFPSGFSTAVLIGVLHGKGRTNSGALDPSKAATFGSLALENQDLLETWDSNDEEQRGDGSPMVSDGKQSWADNIRLLLLTFGISGIYTLSTFFFPVLRNLPIFGTAAAETWLWTLNPSFAYVGQGIIMGPATTIHMLLGAVIGWGILSPLAKSRGWAPGPINDWETGSKGWIVWISLAIMLADAVISLGNLALRPLVERGPSMLVALKQNYDREGLRGLFQHHAQGYTAVSGNEGRNSTSSTGGMSNLDDEASGLKIWDHDDAPPSQLVGTKTVSIGLVLSVLFCIASIHFTFGELVPLYGTIIAVFMAMLLSIMGVRALGETDLNPVSGISKIAQLFFALIIPQTNKASVLINLIAGAVSEAGALQAGDLMQDLKTGHLLGAAPKAQFWGQLIGATVGAVVSAWIYRLYTAVYQVPGELFQVPTAYVWIFTARLVTGKGLPYMAWEFSIAATVLFAVFTVMRIRGIGSKWHDYIPGGIAVAVGMYNVPSFTLARTIGGLMSWFWRVKLGRDDTPLIVLASGFILGEGFLSIVNLLLQSARVPHL